ncbi:MAG: hypothetical protein MR842_05175 [Clostridiales bacterium]|nr:hypothetical protein [Clostridiales bacterium]MDO4350757.1 hypothetical protein [Eubacteriales bacterium]MDY4009321.1 hypothetical protein [Candidatus Limiplasma sp.]
MDAKYCSRCGAERKNHSNVCWKCGAAFEEAQHGKDDCRYDYTEPYRLRHLPLSCILAYIPFLFWLPLVTDGKDPLHRRCANQGLWQTLTFLLYSAVLFVAWFLLERYAGFSWIGLYHTLFFHWTPANWLSKLPYALGAQAALIFAISPLVNCLCGMLRGMFSDRPYQIPVFGRFQLIRSKA